LCIFLTHTRDPNSRARPALDHTPDLKRRDYEPPEFLELVQLKVARYLLSAVMMLTLFRSTVAILAATGLSSCLYLAHGSTEKVTVKSDPPGAIVEVSDGQMGITPAAFKIRRDQDVVFRVHARGYESADIVDASGLPHVPAPPPPIDWNQATYWEKVKSQEGYSIVGAVAELCIWTLPVCLTSLAIDAKTGAACTHQTGDLDVHLIRSPKSHHDERTLATSTETDDASTQNVGLFTPQCGRLHGWAEQEVR
jgi:hypothetical protein